MEVDQRLAQRGCVLLVHTKNDGFGKSIGLFEKVSQVLRNRLGACAQGDDTFEISGLVFVVRNLAPVAVNFILARSPTRCVPLGEYTVDAVGRKKAVVYALTQTVLVDGVPEILVGVAVVVAERSCSHSKLDGRLEMLKNDPP